MARDELPEGLELLLEEVSGGSVFEFARLVVKLGRASSNEDFRFVKREGIEEDHHPAKSYGRARRRANERPVDRDRLVGAGWRTRSSQSSGVSMFRAQLS